MYIFKCISLKTSNKFLHSTEGLYKNKNNNNNIYIYIL